MKLAYFKYFIVLFFYLSFAGCNKDPVEVGKIQNFRIEKISTKNVIFCIGIPITNHSILPFRVENGELHAFADNIEIGSAFLAETLKISSLNTKIYPIHIRLEFTNPDASLNMALNTLLGKKNTYLIKGTINARSIIVQKKINIEQSFIK
jgi:hypothetical protein